MTAFVACSADAQTQAAAETALRTGKYEEAISQFTRLAAGDTAPVAAQRGLIRALTLVGRYAEAETFARRAMGNTVRVRQLSNVLGEVFYARGQVDSAEAAFTRAVREQGSDSLRALVNLGIVHFDRGQYRQAYQEFDRFIDIYNGGAGKLTSDELAAVGMACRYLGIREPALFKDALRALDRAVAADSGNIEARIDIAYLFLEKYNGADAKTEFDQILALNPSHPRALLGAARGRDFDGLPGADSLLRRALAVNPNYIPAHIFAAELLLQTENTESALAAIQKALAIDPGSSDALAVVAAIKFVQGDTAGFNDATRRALARNPLYAEVYATAADLSGRNRLYAQAEMLSDRGVAIDSGSARALAVRGMALMRTGKIPEARQVLELAFKLDPYDVWVKNTLDLLDTFKRYRETKTARFVIVADSSEDVILNTYVEPLANEAFEALQKRYNYTPPLPVRLELFRSHTDFSVRTVGLTGLGALGVSFGPVLALDSPSAREKGSFNWASTLWHELAHTFTLGVSDHRVPRWLSEGLSVLEERRARPGWGADVTPGFIAALQSGKIIPVSRLNDGFMRPTFPEQVMFSYYQASLVCEMIEKEYGPTAISAMLQGYKERRSTPEIFQRVLRTSMEDFDKKFDAAIRQRFAVALASIKIDESRREPPTIEEIERRSADLKDYIGQLGWGAKLVQEKKFDEAVVFLRRAKELFPEYAGTDSPAWWLSMVHIEKKEVPQAIAELTELVTRNESFLTPHIMLAELHLTLGNKAAAKDVLESSIAIWPLDLPLHVQLAELYAGLGDKQKAIRERRAVVALKPVDLAEALYQLAFAYHDAGDNVSARREVLKALEEAPNFEKAQTLLLAIRRGAAVGTPPPAAVRPPPPTPPAPHQQED